VTCSTCQNTSSRSAWYASAIPPRNKSPGKQTSRFQEKFILFENQYKRLSGEDFEEMFHETHAQTFHGRDEILGARNVGQSSIIANSTPVSQMR